MCLLLRPHQQVSNNSLLSWGLWNNDVCLVRWGRLIGWANRPQNNYQSLKTLSSVNSGRAQWENIKTNFVCGGPEICTGTHTKIQKFSTCTLTIFNCCILGQRVLRIERNVKLQWMCPDLPVSSHFFSASLWLAAQQKKKKKKRTIHYSQM